MSPESKVTAEKIQVEPVTSDNRVLLLFCNLNTETLYCINLCNMFDVLAVHCWTPIWSTISASAADAYTSAANLDISSTCFLQSIDFCILRLYPVSPVVFDVFMQKVARRKYFELTFFTSKVDASSNRVLFYGEKFSEAEWNVYICSLLVFCIHEINKTRTVAFSVDQTSIWW